MLAEKHRLTKMLFISLILIFLAFWICNVNVNAASETDGTIGNCRWNIDGDILTISGNGKMQDYSEPGTGEFPPYYYSEAFYNVTRIMIEEGVTHIGDYSFVNKNAITSISIPSSLESVGEGAFDNTGYYNNDSNWENGVLYIGNNLIDAKEFLSGKYTIKNGTKTIAGSAFYGCENLTGLIIPDSVISIGKKAFYDCNNLTKITIPSSVKSFDGDLSRCDNLIVADILSDTAQVSINSGNLERLSLPKSCVKIDGDFSNASGLKITHGGTKQLWNEVELSPSLKKAISEERVEVKCSNGSIISPSNNSSNDDENRSDTIAKTESKTTSNTTSDTTSQDEAQITTNGIPAGTVALIVIAILLCVGLVFFVFIKRK